MDDVTIIEVIREGPPGTGITGAEVAQIQADLTMLCDGTWRGTPKLALQSLPVPVDGASTTLANMPGFPLTSVPGLDNEIAHRIEITGRVKVTSPTATVVSVGATLGSVGTGTLEDSPTGAGTHWLACSGVWTIGSGISSATAYLSYKVDPAATVTFEEAHLELRVTPRSDV